MLKQDRQAAENRMRRWLLLEVAFVVGYLDAIFFVIPQDFLGYKFNQFLFDYAHGFARRSLEGEILRHLVSPPYSIGFFREFAGVQTMVALVLFAVIVMVVAFRSLSTSTVVLALLIISSPTTFKNLVFDIGRQDAIGVIAVEAAILLGFLESRTLLPIFLSVITLPLALINENLLLLYLPACLAIHGCRAVAGWRERLEVNASLSTNLAPLVVFAISCLICLRIPSPTIPRDAYHNYLQSKSLQRLAPGEPERWLYSSAADNFAFARGEWSKFRHLQSEGLQEYLIFGIVLVLACGFVARSLKGRGGKDRRLYLLGLLWILPGYVVLFFGASDIARWFANLNLSILLFSYWYLAWADAKPEARVWLPMAPVAAIQLIMIGGFGIVFPVFDIGGDFVRFLSLF